MNFTLFCMVNENGRFDLLSDVIANNSCRNVHFNTSVETIKVILKKTLPKRCLSKTKFIISLDHFFGIKTFKDLFWVHFIGVTGTYI